MLPFGKQPGECEMGACRRKAKRTVTFTDQAKRRYCDKCADTVQAPPRLVRIEDGKVRR